MSFLKIENVFKITKSFLLLKETKLEEILIEFDWFSIFVSVSNYMQLSF